MPPQEQKRTPVLTFRSWAGALVVAALAGAITQILIHELLMDTSMLARHELSGALDTLAVLVPILLYLGWRRTAAREETALRELQASEALREDLVNMLVHDLKGPAATAGMAIHAVARSRTAESALTGEDREMLRIAEEGIARLERLIGDTLDTASGEKGNLRLSKSSVDLTALVRAALLDASLPAKERGIELRGEVPSGPIEVRADGERIRRVVDNLLANAVRFTPRGGFVEVCAASEPGGPKVTVSDSGPGVPAGMRERIFEKYAQAEGASGRRMSVGLGLAFSKLVVEAHGGRIWVDERPGGGSAFSLTLPSVPDRDERPADPAPGR